MKRCSKCHEEKDDSQFHRAGGKRKGLQAYCKACGKAANLKWQKTSKAAVARKKYRQGDKFKSYNREFQKQYRKTESGRAANRRINTSAKGKERFKRFRETIKYIVQHRKHSAAYQDNHPEVVKAHNAVMRAVKSGKLQRPTTLKCQCGNQAQHYHHYKGYDPDHWLDVIPLCRQCHANAHSIP